MQGKDSDPITIRDAGLRIGDLPTSVDRFEDIMVALVGKFETGEAFFLFDAMNKTLGKSGPDGYYFRGDNADGYTMLVVAEPPESPTGLMDNNFIRRGWAPNEIASPDRLSVTTDADEVVWQLEGRTHIVRPGPQGAAFYSRGTKAGVELDLTHKQSGSTMWWGGGVGGHWEDASALERRTAGFWALYETTGSITYSGHTRQVADAVGIWEHITFLEPVNPVIGNHALPVVWYFLIGGTPEFQIHLTFFPDSDGPGDGQLVIAGTTIDFTAERSQGRIEWQTTQWWDDPRSGIHGPTAWKITMSGEPGRLTLDVHGFARGFYPYIYGNGQSTVTWVLASITGQFETPDGRIWSVPDGATVSIEWGKVTSTIEETMSGSVAEYRPPSPAR
jgi:hypothetical protein